MNEEIFKKEILDFEDKYFLLMLRKIVKPEEIARYLILLEDLIQEIEITYCTAVHFADT